MSRHDAIILAHGGELDGARPYEEVTSPFEAQRLLLLPLCAEKLAPEKIIPPLRLSAHKSRLTVLVVPVLKEMLVPECKPGWTGEHPCARCVMERWREVMGGNPIWHGGPKLERLRTDEDVEGGGAKLLAFVRSNRPGFAFEASSPLAVPAVQFKFSGGAAAIFLGNFLFVQTRERVPGPDAIEALATVRLPKEPRRSHHEGDRLKLEDGAIYEPEWTAEHLGIAVGTLYNWVSNGKIPHVKVGGNLRFPGEALRKWLESRTEWPTDDGEDDDGPEDTVVRFPWDKKC